MTVKSELIDARNWAVLKDLLIQDVSEAGIVGFDIETCDPDRHAGLTDFMKAGGGKRLVFDVNRTIVTGFSWYCDDADTAYYLNLNHADVENRIPWSEARQILDARPTGGCHTLCHNAPFELTMMQSSLGFDLGPDVICTMQMAVSTFNEDQYAVDDMMSAGFGGIQSLLVPLGKAFATCDPQNLTEVQGDLMSRVLAKTSVAAHSYNGMVREMSYGYGLKKLTRKFFGYEQTEFKTVLNGKAHMGELTGDEVCAYGADDAYWCVRLFHKFLPMMMAQNDQLWDTFLTQENPMIYVFADIWSNGLVIDLDAVTAKRDEERQNYAAAVRQMHAHIRGMLPYPEALNEGLKHDKWYAKNPTSYRKKITAWAMKDLPDDNFAAVYSTAGPVSAAWAADRGLPKSTGPNLSYYMSVRSIMYDLTGLKPRMADGKVASDKKAREKMKGKGIDDLLEIMTQLAGIEQRMKLYLTPYTQLIDPETGRVYPVVSSRLNSRRMAMSNPNGMQLAKRGESTYIRGFYKADAEDHVIVSIDWSQVELVEIGDFSGDPEFANAFGQIPYNDLHKKAVSDLMDIAIEDVTKKLRGDVGKVANFNYWYSGALSTVGDIMGWSSDKMWEMTDRYRTTFAIAEKWRTDLIIEAREKGYVTLPDGHRRHRFEASYIWQRLWTERWAATRHQGLVNFGDLFVKRITSRAGNQIVNSMIQGSCATLAKRSILGINAELKSRFRFRFLMPIHDELVFSVHKDDAVGFIKEAKRIMCDHPTIITRLVLDATASCGRNFEPFDIDRAPLGQIELDEAPEILGFTKDQKLDDDGIQTVIDYLFNPNPVRNAA